MKIVHITPAAPYNDNWGYQDNLLPRYHAKLGHDVSIITTNLIHKDGGIIAIDCGDYVLQDGVHVYRFARHVYKNKVLTSISHKIDIYPLLKELEPDFVFFHGLSSTTIIDVIKYKKKANKPCVIVQDNHVDYNIAYAAKSALRNKMIRLFYRCLNHYSIKYVDKVYGVTPWRKMYAEDIFGIPSSKTDVLIMGADDEKLRFDKREEIRTAIRNQYGVRTDEFLIVTGGKIDSRKK